jgi:hypothetical protein
MTLAQRQATVREQVVASVTQRMQSAKSAISAAGYAALKGDANAAALVYKALRAVDRANAELQQITEALNAHNTNLRWSSSRTKR